MKKISQREARRAIKAESRLRRILENQRSAWAQEYFGATQIATVTCPADDVGSVAVRTARLLKHAVVVVVDEPGKMRLMALPHPKEPI